MYPGTLIEVFICTELGVPRVAWPFCMRRSLFPNAQSPTTSASDDKTENRSFRLAILGGCWLGILMLTDESLISGQGCHFSSIFHHAGPVSMCLRQMHPTPFCPRGPKMAHAVIHLRRLLSLSLLSLFASVSRFLFLLTSPLVPCSRASITEHQADRMHKSGLSTPQSHCLRCIK